MEAYTDADYAPVLWGCVRPNHTITNMYQSLSIGPPTFISHFDFFFATYLSILVGRNFMYMALVKFEL